MGKALASWSGMRKYLEEEMLAEPLKGRVRYGCTTYVGMDGCRVFELFLDGRSFKRFSWETVNSWFIREGISPKERPMSTGEYWRGFQALLKAYPASARTEYTDEEFCAALERYRNQPIGESLGSGDPLEKMFALLDRRTGRRALEKMREEMASQPEWLRAVYRLRTEGTAQAEGLPGPNEG